MSKQEVHAKQRANTIKGFIQTNKRACSIHNGVSVFAPKMANARGFGKSDLDYGGFGGLKLIKLRRIQEPNMVGNINKTDLGKGVVLLLLEV